MKKSEYGIQAKIAFQNTYFPQVEHISFLVNSNHMFCVLKGGSKGLLVIGDWGQIKVVIW